MPDRLPEARAELSVTTFSSKDALKVAAKLSTNAVASLGIPDDPENEFRVTVTITIESVAP
jgi:hypothetical protein